MRSFHSSLRRACSGLVAAAIVCGVCASAQETFATLIENDASATVDATPTIIVFRLTKTYWADSLADAVRDAQEFAPALRDALKAAGYERAALGLTGPMIPGSDSKMVRLSAEIRLPLSSTGEEGTRSTAFANAVDQLASIAEKLGADLLRPALDVSNRAEIEQKAVQRAIENAFGRSEAAATVMQLQIVSVDRVTIESVTWQDRYVDGRAEVSADRIGVTAKVKVAYLAMPPGR